MNHEHGKAFLLFAEQKGWTQEQAAPTLGVSQPYLSLLEKGTMRVPEKLARKAATLYGLSAAKLPVETGWHSAHVKSHDALASDLVALGYPGPLISQAPT